MAPSSKKKKGKVQKPIYEMFKCAAPKTVHVSSTHWKTSGSRNYSENNKFDPELPIFKKETTMFYKFVNCFARSKPPGSWTKQECSDEAKREWLHYKGNDARIKSFLEEYPPPCSDQEESFEYSLGTTESKGQDPIDLTRDEPEIMDERTAEPPTTKGMTVEPPLKTAAAPMCTDVLDDNESFFDPLGFSNLSPPVIQLFQKYWDTDCEKANVVFGMEQFLNAQMNSLVKHLYTFEERSHGLINVFAYEKSRKGREKGKVRTLWRETKRELLNVVSKFNSALDLYFKGASGKVSVGTGSMIAKAKAELSVIMVELTDLHSKIIKNDSNRNNLLRNMKKMLDQKTKFPKDVTDSEINFSTSCDKTWDEALGDIFSEASSPSKFFEKRVLLALGSFIQEYEVVTNVELLDLLLELGKVAPPLRIFKELEGFLPIIFCQHKEQSSFLIISRDCVLFSGNTIGEKVISFLDTEVDSFVDGIIEEKLKSRFPQMTNDEIFQVLHPTIQNVDDQNELNSETEPTMEQLAEECIDFVLDNVFEKVGLGTADLALGCIDFIVENVFEKVGLCKEQVAKECVDSILDNVFEEVGLGKKVRGRKPYYVRYPALKNTVINYLEMNGFKAQRRRRTDVGEVLAMGGSLKALKEYVENEIDNIVISRHTIHRLFVAPRKGTNAAARYKGIINARVPHKRNSHRDDKEDGQHNASLVRFVMELVANNPNLADLISADDKAKINVGTLAVSRYHQIRKFFLSHDAPNYDDHDFPDRGSKITPSGYLIMDFRSAEVEVDKFNRTRTNLARTGELVIVNRAFRFHSSTAESHVNDLFKLHEEKLKQKDKPGLLLITDGGWDFNVKSELVKFYLGRLWRRLEKDFLGSSHYAAGDSALNPVERYWSDTSDGVTGVTFDNTLPGEELPPWKQSDLTKDEEISKSKQVLDNAMFDLCRYLNKVEVCGKKVESTYLPCDHEKEPWDDFDDVQWYFDLAPTKRKKPEEHFEEDELELVKRLNDEHLDHLGHMDARSAFLLFTRCLGEDPCAICQGLPAVSPESIFLFELLKKHGNFFTPIPDNDLPGHFLTYHKFISTEKSLKVVPDNYLPSLTRKAKQENMKGIRCQICSRAGPARGYVFSSMADLKRHCLFLHKSVKDALAEKGSIGRKRTKTPADAVFTCKPCKKEFKTLSGLRNHQKQTGHQNLRKKSRKRAKKSKTNFSLRTANFSHISSSDEEVEFSDGSSDESSSVDEDDDGQNLFPILTDADNFSVERDDFQPPMEWVEIFNQNEHENSDASSTSEMIF